MPTPAQLRLRIAAIIAAPVICLTLAGVADAAPSAPVAAEKTKTVGGKANKTMTAGGI